MSKQFLAILALIVLVFVGIVVFSGNKSNGSGSGKSSSGTAPTQHIEGQGKDGITLVEYGDYQCPYCGQYFQIVQQVQAEYNQQLFFQFRNFPLTNLHPNAFAGARAAEAAGLQGKFWQMHDLLYEQNQAYYNGGEPANSWIGASSPEPYFEADAQQLGLNVTQFKNDYASDTVNNLISADMAAGNKLGVDATPSFYLDGKAISVGESVSAFEKLINAEIAKKAGQASSAPTSAGATSQTKK
jgi:protein-disulfide isomerase